MKKILLIIPAICLWTTPVLAQEFVSRGELVSDIIEDFSLAEKKKNVVEACYRELEFCLFNFSTISLFDGMDLESMKLYPDVNEDNEHYEAINLATILGIVNGYNEENSPFKPENTVTRIQALKIILGATDLVQNRYRFELVMELGSEEALKEQELAYLDQNAEDWWQPRYINFALRGNIIDAGDFFRPNEEITRQELEDMLDRTKDYLESNNEKIYARGNSTNETFGGRGKKEEA